MKNKRLFIGLLVISILAIAFFAGGNKEVIPISPEDISGAKDIANNIDSQSDKNQVSMNEEINKLEKEIFQRIEKDVLLGKSSEKSLDIGEENSTESETSLEDKRDKYLTDHIPEGKPEPVEWQDVTKNTDEKLTATLSVTCKTILNNMDMFNDDKLEVLPEDGVIYATKKITFYEGESVFDVLLREMKDNKIHMEFAMTPIYNSNYVAGINNIYEFDCGELSGWMYKVNDWFPNYGVSRYQLEDGDVIELIYTCDLGRDIGTNSILQEVENDDR